jgi:hypothetical protein
MSRSQIKTRAATFIAIALATLSAQAEVVVYPSPKLGANTAGRTSTLYQVRVTQDGRSRDSFVYEIPADRELPTRHNVCSFTTFSFDGRVSVEVTKLAGDAIKVCDISPRSYGIKAQIVSSNTVRFTLTKPASKLAVIFNDDWKTHPLLVFGDPLERDIPKPADKDTIYFAPGVHEAGKISVRSGQTVYLAGGAYVKGWIEENSLRNVTVRGRGIISAENRPDARGGLNKQTIYFNGDGSHLRVEGITFIQSKGFACTMRGTSNLVSNCKVVGNWVPTTDGFVMDDHGVVEDCFIKADDDAIKLYGSHGIARRCVIWQMENGGVFQFGWTRQNASDCRVSDVDIIRTEWTTTERDARGIIASVGLAGAGGGHVFENIRVERGGGRIISMNMKSNSAAFWTNVLIRNLTVENWNPVQGQINGAGFKDITFENFRLNGQLVTNAAAGGIKLLNGAGEVRFTTKP